MALTQRLEFRQSQSLVMTPQLMQAIKLLQLSNLDLVAFVEEELERNPLLERVNDGAEPPVRGEPQPERAEFSDRDDPGTSFDDGPGDRAEMANGSGGDNFEPVQEEWLNRDLGSRAEIEQTLDTGLDNVFPEEPAEAAARSAQDAAPTAYTEWGGGASNDDSYNLEAFVAAEITLGSHLAEQLAVAFTAPARRMIGQYLIDLVDAARMHTVVPDVYVRPGPDGGWHVELNSDTLPRVLVNQVYYSELSKTIRKDGDKSYFTDCLQNATWLVRALDQRARTILKVATEIVRQQDGFFTQGVAHLRPLNLKAVADAIQMHESTVSRVTANKYMATNRGSFELKYFFTASIASADGGEAHSAEAVRHHIKQLIDAEDPSVILSDDTI